MLAGGGGRVLLGLMARVSGVISVLLTANVQIQSVLLRLAGAGLFGVLRLNRVNAGLRLPGGGFVAMGGRRIGMGMDLVSG